MRAGPGEGLPRQDLYRIVVQAQPCHLFQIDDHTLIREANHGKAAGQPLGRRFNATLAQTRILQAREPAPGSQRYRPCLAPAQQIICQGHRIVQCRMGTMRM